MTEMTLNEIAKGIIGECLRGYRHNSVHRSDDEEALMDMLNAVYEDGRMAAGQKKISARDILDLAALAEVFAFLD